MFQVIGYIAFTNSKLSLGEQPTLQGAVLSAEAAFVIGNFDGAVVNDLDANRQVFSIGENT